MSVNVKGRNIDVTPALKEYVEKKITKVTKQFKTVGDISAVLKVEKGNHIVEITVPASGILLRAQETTKDMYSSIDLVVEKIERQIHKYKTRLMKRKYSNFADTAVPAPAPATEAADDANSKSLRITLHHASDDSGRSNPANESVESRFLRILRSIWCYQCSLPP